MPPKDPNFPPTQLPTQKNKVLYQFKRKNPPLTHSTNSGTIQKNPIHSIRRIDAQLLRKEKLYFRHIRPFYLAGAIVSVESLRDRLSFRSVSHDDCLFCDPSDRVILSEQVCFWMFDVEVVFSKCDSRENKTSLPLVYFRVL